MKKLNSWFEIDEKEYLMYILHGYEISAYDDHVCWKVDGQLHREDGPAYIHVDGFKAWKINDKRHRLDGPAVIYSDGHKSWYINDVEYTEDQFDEKIKQLV